MTKLTKTDKDEIIKLIEKKQEALGSYSAVATFLKVSTGTISQMRGHQYEAKGDDMWLDVAAKLGWRPKSNTANTWLIAETTDYKNVLMIVADAKNNSLFIPISDHAGIGKSAPLKAIADQQQSNGVYYIRCWDWGKKEFLENLTRSLGIDTGRGFKTPNSLIQLVIEFFQSRSLTRPLLIIDEADKLKGSAIRFLIPLYNECEDALGVVIAGTENLEREIKRGVSYQLKGYDEIDSRFGRKYMKLLGCTIKEATGICNINGVKDTEVIKGIFEECKPVRKIIKIGNAESSIRVITDLRRLKRLVQKQRFKLSNS